MGGTVIVPPANANWNPSLDDSGPTRYVALSNASTAAVFLGTAGVTTATGYSLAASGTLAFWLYPDEALYGIVASTASVVSYIENGV